MPRRPGLHTSGTPGRLSLAMRRAPGRSLQGGNSSRAPICLTRRDSGSGPASIRGSLHSPNLEVHIRSRYGESAGGRLLPKPGGGAVHGPSKTSSVQTSPRRRPHGLRSRAGKVLGVAQQRGARRGLIHPSGTHGVGLASGERR